MQSTALRSIVTRFRAYQLGEKGSSYSYFSGGKFTLIEARRTEALSHRRLVDELDICGKKMIDTLHITSWDWDHCNPRDLSWILNNLKPQRVEYPGYQPESDCGLECIQILRSYLTKSKQTGMNTHVVKIDPEYIEKLEKGRDWGYNDLIYHPKTMYKEHNDNSTVKIFRSGSFSVASLGDIEHPTIGAYLRRCNIFKSEIDVMVLPHHGAESEISTKKFFRIIKPLVTVCTSNFDNQYSHPHDSIKNILYEQGIRNFTTKTGDVIIESTNGHTSKFRVTNLSSNSDKVSSTYDYTSKKSELLRFNSDTLRNRYDRTFKGKLK